MAILLITYILLLAACSIQERNRYENRVVGGKEATDGLVPSQVALKTKNNWTFCGGAVISDRWILTAAHCIRRLKPPEFVAVVGALSRTRGGTSYDISRVVPHKSYNQPTHCYENDIGVISTKKKIEFNKNVQSLALPDTNTPSGTLCLLSGWGKRGKNKSTPDKLQYLYVRTLTGLECNRYYTDKSFTVTSKQLCTLNKLGEGSCQGDSGGSLVCNGTSAGIVSFNRPCAQNFPDGYTNTYMYISWIAENTKSP